jgi:type II secretory pathway predicted ATPase ExeA
MYRKHFGLTRHPFTNEIDVDDLFPSAAMRELEARLKYLLELRGIGLVTGEPGSGKTTVTRRVTTQLHKGL